MKKRVAVLLGLGLVLAFTLSVTAADSHWAGWISDSKCGAGGAKAEHKACALKCMEGGQKLVLVTSDQKVHALDNQALAKEHLGHEVTVHGTADANGDINVSKIEMAKAK
jgi:uncharacterized protein DUF5818